MKDRERWMELAEQAAVEQDGERLSALVQEITRLLDEKQKGLGNLRRPKTDEGGTS